MLMSIRVVILISHLKLPGAGGVAPLLEHAQDGPRWVRQGGLVVGVESPNSPRHSSPFGQTQCTVIVVRVLMLHLIGQAGSSAVTRRKCTKDESRSAGSARISEQQKRTSQTVCSNAQYIAYTRRRALFVCGGV
jgi:hypothetical protein